MSNPNVVIITGASAGIGHAITRTLLNQDAYVVLVDIDERPLQSFLEDYGEEKVRYIVGDVSQDATNSAAVAKALQTWGRIDGVVLNAGVLTPVHRLEGVDAAEWARGFGVNVVSQVSMVRRRPLSPSQYLLNLSETRYPDGFVDDAVAQRSDSASAEDSGSGDIHELGRWGPDQVPVVGRVRRDEGGCKLCYQDVDARGARYHCRGDLSWRCRYTARASDL